MKTTLFLITLTLCLNLFAQQSEQDSIKLDYRFFAKSKYLLNGEVISRSEFKSIMFKNELAKSEYIQGKTCYVLYMVITTPSLILLLNQIDNMDTYTPNKGLFLGSLAGTAVGVSLLFIGKSKIEKSVKIFNNANVNTSLLIEPNNIGLALKF